MDRSKIDILARRWGLRVVAGGLLIGVIGVSLGVRGTALVAQPAPSLDPAKATVSCETLSVTVLGGSQPVQQQLLDLLSQKCGSEKTDN